MGHRRIQRALANLGHLLAHNTIVTILKQNGIEPAPERSQKTSWKDFFFGEDALCTAVSDFIAHYHFERNHQGLGNKLIVGAGLPPAQVRRMWCATCTFLRQGTRAWLGAS